MGTFGGSNGEANWLNEAGEVVGNADFPGDLFHDGFLWKNGVMTDLGNLGRSSTAYSINSNGQVVGASTVKPGDFRAFLWEDGGPMIDLNTRIPASSSLQLVWALSINDRGEIAGIGVPPGVSARDYETLGHAFLLIPADGDNAEDITKSDPSLDDQAQEVRQNDSESTSPVTQSNAVTGGMVAPSGARQINENLIPGRRLGRF